MSNCNFNIPFHPIPHNPTTVKILTGQTFGLWLVFGLYGHKGNSLRWLCKCSCGTWKLLDGRSLTAGLSKCCGSGHGLPNKALRQKVWKLYKGAKTRCNNPNATGYHNYGGRDIKFCFTSFQDFLDEVGFRPSPQHSLDRMDNNGNYEKGNVRWATRLEQANNTRNVRIMTHNGISQTWRDWATMLNTSVKTLYHRYYELKWTIDRTLSQPIRFRPNKKIPEDVCEE